LLAGKFLRQEFTCLYSVHKKRLKNTVQYIDFQLIVILKSTFSQKTFTENKVFKKLFQKTRGLLFKFKLSADLKAEFLDLKGLSPRNLRYMREFATAYPAGIILQAQTH